MQSEHEKEFRQELEAERGIVKEEAAPILREVKELRAEVAELRKAMGSRSSG
jgi:voltage-gated sodium channel